MKHLKPLGLFVVAAAAMMAFTATASATAVTSNGSVYTGNISGTAEGNTSLHGPLGIKAECASEVGGNIETHGASVTPIVTLYLLIFNLCPPYSITIINLGRWEIHTQSASNNNNGTVTSTGTTMTVTTPLGFNCEYTTNNTHIGTLTGSATTGGKATLDISAQIPRTGHSAFCGSSGTWTGSYVFNSPSNLNIH